MNKTTVYWIITQSLQEIDVTSNLPGCLPSNVLCVSPMDILSNNSLIMEHQRKFRPFSFHGVFKSISLQNVPYKRYNVVTTDVKFDIWRQRNNSSHWRKTMLVKCWTVLDKHSYRKKSPTTCDCLQNLFYHNPLPYFVIIRQLRQETKT
jgi:hypothetical protein